MSDTEFANQALGGLFDVLQHLTETRDSLDDLAERYGAEITDNIELVRALRWQIEFYKSEARELQEQLKEANIMAADLSDSNMDLRLMVSSERRRTLAS